MQLVRKLRDESGPEMILISLCMTCLLGLVWFVADAGTHFCATREFQIAAGAGAIPGAAEPNYGGATAAAVAAAAQSGVVVGTNCGDGGQTGESVEADPDRSMAVHAKAIRWGTDGVGMAFLAPGHSPTLNGQGLRSQGADRISLQKIVRQV